MKKSKADFEQLVGRIQTTSEALQQDALVVINRSVTARAWLTGYYIVEYEQHGADRAKYGDELLKRLAARLGADKFAAPTLKTYRLFYKLYPALSGEICGYLTSRFGKSSTASIQLAGEATKALSEKGSTVSSLSVEQGLLIYSGDEIAQLSLYMAYYRKNKMTAGDNPPIGILLCNAVGKETAEYLAPFTDKQLFLSEYQLQLPAKEAFTEFLKKENEGLAAPADAKSAKDAKKRKGMRVK